VSHTAETFVGLTVGTPLYYNVTTSSGYFNTNPVGVVFLKTLVSAAAGASTFTVSAVPDGDVIDLQSAMTGTFQQANQARTFAGNNVNALTEITVPIIKDAAIAFDGANNGLIGSEPQANTLATVASYSGSLINVSTTASAGLTLYSGAMVRYSTTGSAATGLTNNTTYFIDTFFNTGTDTYSFTIKPLPTDAAVTSISGGTGTQTFTRIGVSLDKDIVHIRNSNFVVGDLLKYTFPAEGNFAADSELSYYFVNVAYDNHNYKLSDSLDSLTTATGGTVTQMVENGSTWNVHTFTTVGTTNFVVSALSNEATVQFLLVGGGGGGANDSGGGGGGGAVIRGTTTLAGAGTYPVVVGDGGVANTGSYSGGIQYGSQGGSTTFNGITATGGGGGAAHLRPANPTPGANSGGGADAGGNPSAGVAPTLPAGTTGTVYAGFKGGNPANGGHRSGGGAGAGGAAPNSIGYGGPGVAIDIDGNTFYYGGGGGGGVWAFPTYAGGIGGGGGGGTNTTFTGAQGGRAGRNVGANGVSGQDSASSGGAGGANTGGGGGGGTFYGSNGARAGKGGSGIAIIRYRATPQAAAVAPVATGGTITTQTISGVTYRRHTYLSGTSSFVVTDPGNIGKVEILVVAGGGGGGWDVGGGGGGGGVLYASNFQLAAQTYNISIGSGGNGATSNVIGGQGGNTTFGSATAFGGGGGGSWSSIAGNTGGSGGGNVSNRAENHYSTQTNFTGFAGLGHPGGGASNNTSNQNNYAGASGGGGAGGPGGNGDSGAFGANSTQYAFGGAGFVSSITGTTAYYATGGPGAADSDTHYGAAATGGAAFKANAANNTGGGGGGGSLGNTGGNGGSGIVVIRYPLAFPA
jgi:hypothetical protein